MATQNKIKMKTVNGSTWTEIAQPDELGYSFETTYTEDSGRVQSGKAITSAMFTVEAFTLKYSFLKLSEARTIAQFIVKGTPFMLHYPSVYYSGWRDDKFYVGKGQVRWGSIIVDEEIVEDFEFNVVGVNPL